jgi:polyketide synthase PksN
VVLKRLDDALEDGDTIHAVILGSAINNDGHDKAGFTAPGADGQTAVISDALALANVDARSVGYVEAHGTATPLGDPVEVASLTRAYRACTEDTGYCTLGSVKTNLGHLDAAAGVTGLIKATLSVREGTVPGTLHFRTPNPRLELERTPFVVRAETAPWAGPSPRRAGVSSFGIGGTNAHLVLEEPPAPSPRRGTPGAVQLLVVSARSAEACAAYARAIADRLGRDPRPELADVAHTLQVGRAEHEWRLAVAAADAASAAAALRAAVPARTLESPPAAPAIDLPGADPRAEAEALGRAWCAGARVDWAAYAAGRGGRRVPLPTYPFERRRYYIEAPRPAAPAPAAVAAGGGEAPAAAAEAAPARHARPQLGTPYVAPSSELEETIAAIWCELLSTEEVGVHDNFFELGGHSLLGTRVVARLRTLFGVDLPVEVVFRAPTVHVLAQVVEAALLEALESMSEEEALGLA